jgi:hypothetical protein
VTGVVFDGSLSWLGQEQRTLMMGRSPEDRKRTESPGFAGRGGEPLSGVVTHSNELWIRLQKKMMWEVEIESGMQKKVESRSFNSTHFVKRAVSRCATGRAKKPHAITLYSTSLASEYMRLATRKSGCVNDLMRTGLKGWEKALGETGTLPGAYAECPNIGKLN